MKRFITMRWVFAVCTGVLGALSVAVWRLQPPQAPRGKLALTWVSDENPLRTQQADLFNRSHPTYRLGLDPSNGGVEKVIVQSIGGVGPDLFDCFDGYQLAAYVRSGIALDVTDELRKRGIDVASKTFHGIAGVAIYAGRVYGVPTNIASDGVWFHKDLFDAAGLPYPSKPMRWPEMIELAQKLTVRNASGRITRFGLLLPWWNWRHVFAGFGARIFSSDGTRCLVDRPEAIAAVQLMRDLVYRYHVCPTPSDSASMTSQGGFGSSDINIFGAKRAAMAIGGRWWLAQMRDMKGLRLGVFESPYDSTREFRGYGRATMVNRNTPHLEAALDFLAFLATPSYNRLVNDQADGISAFKEYAQGDRFLHDAKHPDETYNEVWRESAERSIPDEISPYIDGNVANRLLQKQFDLVQGDLKSPAQAMRDAAREVNEEIRKNMPPVPSTAIGGGS